MDESKRIEALAEYLECEVEDLEKVEYRENAYEFGSEEYLILSEEEADEEAREYIESSLWAFNAGFIIEHSALPWEAQEMVQSYQEDSCESANATIAGLIEDMDEFVSDAISADGRGHFMNSYDGEEVEVQVNGIWLYIYRMG